MSAHNSPQALVDAINASNAKSGQLLATLDGIIEQMELRVAQWKTEASWVDIYNIVEDVKKGVFSEPNTKTIKFYNDDLIAVIAQVDNYYYPINLKVTLTDDNGDEYPLCKEQYDMIYTSWIEELEAAELEAIRLSREF